MSEARFVWDRYGCSVWAWRKRRAAVIARDGHCLICGSRDGLTADHIVPVSAGGESHIGNLQTLCRPCNARKAATAADYRGVVHFFYTGIE